MVVNTPYENSFRRQANMELGEIKLQFLSPSIMLVCTTLLFFITLLFIPFDVLQPLSISGIVFWFICWFCFLGGGVLGAGNRTKMQISNFNNRKKTTEKFVAYIVIFGLIGVVFQIVDRYFIRGVSFFESAFEVRDVLFETKASLFSVIAALFGSIGMLSYIVIWIAENARVKIRKVVKALSLISLMGAFFMSVQIGSRSLVLILAITYILTWVFSSRFRCKKLNKYRIFLIVFFVVTLIVSAALVMAARVELMGIAMTTSILYSTYAYTIQPSNLILSAIEGSDFEVLFAALFSVIQYVYHGIYEFGLLFSDFSGEHELGTQIFWLPFKLASVLQIPIPVFQNTGVRDGIFTTFMGPVFIDFGLLSPFFLFIFGYIASLPYRFLLRGKVAWFPAAALVTTGMLFWPIMNIFTSASGTYLLVASIVIGIFGETLNSSQKKYSVTFL
ncbi:hypothetical protein BH11PSE12_BH11PSE12_00290 [soil metagenome]